MKQLVIFFVASILSLASPSGYSAGHCYKAIQIEGSETKDKPLDPVCYALERNLNEFCDEPPVVCGMKISPKYAKELSLPVWTPVDFGDNLSFVENIIRSQWMGFPVATQLNLWNLERLPLEEALNEGRLSVSTANFDLFRLGIPFKFYRIDAGDCRKNNAHLDRNDPDAWGLKATGPNMQLVPAPGEVKEPAYQIAGGLPGDAFFFKGKVYFSYMTGLLGKYWKLADKPYYENVITIKQGDNQLVQSKGPMLFGKDVCQLKYRTEIGK